MTRRRFSQLVLSAAVLCMTGMRWVGAHAIPSRVLKALKLQTFPGHLRPLDEAEIRKEGKWKG